MSTVKVGTENSTSIELYYEDHGTGRPVVLIHGWPLSGRSWEAQVGPLVDAGFRVITYDRRGFGESSKPWTGYDYDTLAADLNTLVEHLNLRDAALVGFSMGGGEVVRYLAKHNGGGRVTRAVLAGAVPPNLYKSADNPEGALDDKTIHGFQEAVRTDRLAFLDDFTRNFFSARGQLKVSERQRKFARLQGSLASPKGTLECINAWGRTDFREDVKKVKVPLLVLHGDADAIVPFEVSGKRVAAMVPGAKTALIKDGPHGFNASHPAEFNRALLEFLKG
jgi:non-heme chloroperoxidase